jgi:hypothetical protein
MKRATGLVGAVVCASSLACFGCSSGDGGGGSGGSGASGGGSGGGGFTPATPPSDVCSLLSLADVQVFFPAAVAAMPLPVNDPTPDVWARICSYEPKPNDKSVDHVELVVQGATTSQGLVLLSVMVDGLGSKKTPVSGIGEKASYWEQDTSDVGLVAKQGSYAVDVTAYFMTPFPTQDQLAVAVKKVLGEL